jgi:hypothetical protein
MATGIVFKVQRALVSNEESPPVLVYNEDRSIMGQVPATKEVMELFPPNEHKIFVKGSFSNGELFADTIYMADEYDW